MKRIDTRYIFTAGELTYVGRWTRQGFSIIGDVRKADACMNAALDEGWEGHYAGLNFGTRTASAICDRLGHDWEAHSVVALYKEL